MCLISYVFGKTAHFIKEGYLQDKFLLHIKCESQNYESNAIKLYAYCKFYLGTLRLVSYRSCWHLTMFVTFWNISGSFSFFFLLQWTWTGAYSKCLAFLPLPTVGRSWLLWAVDVFFLISDSLCLIEAAPCVLQDGWCGLKETCVSTSALCVLLWCSIFYHLQENTSHSTPPISALYI